MSKNRKITGQAYRLTEFTNQDCWALRHDVIRCCLMLLACRLLHRRTGAPRTRHTTVRQFRTSDAVVPATSTVHATSRRAAAARWHPLAGMGYWMDGFALIRACLADPVAARRNPPRCACWLAWVRSCRKERPNRGGRGPMVDWDVVGRLGLLGPK